MPWWNHGGGGSRHHRHFTWSSSTGASTTNHMTTIVPFSSCTNDNDDEFQTNGGTGSSRFIRRSAPSRKNCGGSSSSSFGSQLVSSRRRRRQDHPPGARTTTTVGATTRRLVWIWNGMGLLACWIMAVFGSMPALDHSSLGGDDVRLMTMESLSSSALFQLLVLRNSPSDNGSASIRTRRRHHDIWEDDLSHQLVVFLTDSRDMVPSLLQPHPDNDNTNGVVVVGPSMMMMMTNRGDADYNNLTLTFRGTNNTLSTNHNNNHQTTTSPQYLVEFPTRLTVSDNPPALEWRPKSRTQQRRDTKHRHVDDDCYEVLGTRTKTTKSHHCESSHVAKAMEFPVCNLFHKRSVPHTLRQSPTSRFVGYVQCLVCLCNRTRRHLGGRG